MRKVLIGALFASTFLASPADAMPGLATVGTAIGTFFTGLNISPLLGAVLRIGGGLILSSLTAPKVPDQKGIKRELPVPNSLVPKRTIYGHTRTTGSPVPWRKKNNVLYGCILYNSRASDGENLSIRVDGRVCTIQDRDDDGNKVAGLPGFTTATPVPLAPEFQGTLTDFSGPGALLQPENFPDWDSTENQFVAWLGLGDQTGPPDQLVTQAPEFFEDTDAWQGNTVLWVRIQLGGNVEKRAKRWPALPPVIELEMDWSKVYDPNDEAQDAEDPDTWTYSDDHGRVCLDAARTNPVRQYALDQVNLDQFALASTVAKETVALQFAGGTEPRYRVAGVIDWTKGELMDLLEPLARAGAGRYISSGGLLGFSTGAYVEPDYTFDDFLQDAPVEMDIYADERDQPAAIKGVYLSEARDYNEAETQPYTVAGTAAQVVGDNIEPLELFFCPSGTQAQRVVKIEAERMKAQKTLSCVLPPSAMALAPGATKTGSYSAPFTRLNGVWKIESCDPGISLGDDEKVIFRVPISACEETASIYAWTPATDEVEIDDGELTDAPTQPGEITGIVASTVEINNGGATLLFIDFEFDEITAAEVEEYDLAFKFSADSAYSSLPSIPAEDALAGTVSGRFGPVEFGASYDLAIRAEGISSNGPWTFSKNIVAGLAIDSAAATLGGAGELDVTGTAPVSGVLAGVRLFRATVGDDFADATQVGADVPISSGAAITETFSGLTAGAADFWIVPSTLTGSNGTASALGSYTIT